MQWRGAVSEWRPCADGQQSCELEADALRGAKWGGTGFVTCVGHRTVETGFSDAETLRGGLRVVRSEFGNADPVVAFHVDDELNAVEKAVLRDRTIAPLYIADVRLVANKATQQATKPEQTWSRWDARFYRSYYCILFSVVHSPFEATMYIDADTLFFQNPRAFWLHPSLRSTGTLFYHDFSLPLPANMRREGGCDTVEWLARSLAVPTRLRPDWRSWMRLYCTDKYFTFESSVVAINRSVGAGLGTQKMLQALLPHIVRNETVRKISHGDTDFFWIACELAGGPCGYNPGGPPAVVKLPDPGNAYSLADGGRFGARGCHAHLTLADPHVPDPAFRGISHSNMDHNCGWETHRVVTHLERTATVWEGDSLPLLYRALAAPETAIIDAYRMAMFRDKTTTLAAWVPPNFGGPERVQGPLRRTQHSRWCKKQIVGLSPDPDERASILRNNTLFDRRDAAFCLHFHQRWLSAPSEAPKGGKARAKGLRLG